MDTATNIIKVQHLGMALRRKRRNEKLNLRQAAQVTGVDANTLSRIERGIGKPEIDTIARIAAWLNLSLENFIAKTHKPCSVNLQPNESIPDLVATHLKRDKHLKPKDARFLEELFRELYQRYRAQQKS